MSLRTLSALLVCAAALHAQSAAPKNFHCTSATTKEVRFEWDAVPGASAYVLERKQANGKFAPAGTVTGTAAVDTSIDPYGIYVYHVRTSTASNDITVGPPKHGFTSVIAVPKSYTEHFDRFGNSPQLALDSNGDPAVAYLVAAASPETTLFFTSWDRANYRWTAPVSVGKTREETSMSDFAPPSLARDAAANKWVIAYPVSVKPSSYRLDIAISEDNGATWKTQTISSGEGPFDSPSVGAANGIVHVATIHEKAIRYYHGKIDEEASAWKSEAVPLAEGAQPRLLSLALDATGSPALAYTVSREGFTTMYWKPGSSPVQAIDHHGHGTDGPDLRLTFSGNKPRIAFNGAVDDHYFGNSHMMWVVASDDGSNWSAPVLVVNHGNRMQSPRIDLTFNSKGQAALVSWSNGGNSEGVKCTLPNIARSPDLQHWTICGPLPLGKASYDAVSPAAIYAPDDSLYITFQNTATPGSPGSLARGLWLWHE
jgi:hypothetical protein